MEQRCLSYIILFLIIDIVASQENLTCGQYFRSVRRAGMNMAGRLEIPMDGEFPKFNLRLKFSRSIHHVSVRQLKARDIGASHTEFVVDPMEQLTDGMLRLDTFIRLRTMFGSLPRIKTIMYNNRILCGDPLTLDQSNTFYLSTSTSKPLVQILFPTTKNPSKSNEDEEDEVFD